MIRTKLAAAATIAIGLLVAAAPAHADEQADAFADLLQESYGITIKPEAADDIARTACDAPLSGVGLYEAQQEVLQRYPKNSLDLVARVMSAGVLAYCPERMS